MSDSRVPQSLRCQVSDAFLRLHHQLFFSVLIIWPFLKFDYPVLRMILADQRGSVLEYSSIVDVSIDPYPVS